MQQLLRFTTSKGALAAILVLRQYVLLALLLLLFSPFPFFTIADAQQEAHATLATCDSIDFKISIKLQHETQKLRSIMLHRGNYLLEPHACWSEGNCVSADAGLTEEDVAALLNVLHQRGFFSEARKYYAERSTGEKKSSPPANAEKYTEAAFAPYDIVGIAFIVTGYCSEEWSTIYQMHYSFSPKSRELLQELSAIANEQAKKLLLQLEKQAV